MTTRQAEQNLTPEEWAKQLRTDGMRCNCDLDNWEPEKVTGHSWVCRIHTAAMRKAIGEHQ